MKIGGMKMRRGQSGGCHSRHRRNPRISTKTRYFAADLLQMQQPQIIDAILD
jgi:hypothetical protein